MSKLKLFCFPYAGGSAIIYKKWAPYLDAGIVLHPVELAGRGQRMQEPLYKDAEGAVEDAFQMMQREAGNMPYALFGHSMGSKIVYELAQKIRKDNFPPPVHVFFSGRGAPHVKREDKRKYHEMNDEDFKTAVLQLGGTPPEVFAHPELMELFFPLLRSDFKIAESDIPEKKMLPLDSDITVFLGKTDDLNAAQCDGWKLHTNKRCELYYFPGGHFFLHEEIAGITEVINRNCLKAIRYKK